MVTYDRHYQHHVPTNYSRIRPNRGCGFILSQLYLNGPLTRKQIFKGSKYGDYRPGLLSLLFTALLEDGYIECSNGTFKKYMTPKSYWCRSKPAYRIVAENGVPEYSLTSAGRELVEQKLPKFYLDFLFTEKND